MLLQQVSGDTHSLADSSQVPIHSRTNHNLHFMCINLCAQCTVIHRINVYKFLSFISIKVYKTWFLHSTATVTQLLGSLQSCHMVFCHGSRHLGSVILKVSIFGTWAAYQDAVWQLRSTKFKNFKLKILLV